ncbi:MAG: hypothetical protein H6Q55_1441 [Deltaproteobacteria bacterium]|nr:hypothetical protein [Deltaproteobacteria bacterium]
MKKKHLLIIATLDTKGREASYIRECAEARGVKALLMDVGTLTPPQIVPDITRDDLAASAGSDLNEFLSRKDRASAIRTVQAGGAIKAKRMVERDEINGVIGLGGGTGTAIVTFVMRALPFGIPKVVVSTVASRDVREYVGTKDIVMFHSVADLLGFNDFMRHLLAQAAYAVCGMMEKEGAIKKGRPMVGVTAYGINSGCAMLAEPLLETRGYEMIAFHANGCGGMAMEELIAQGLIAGVLDFNPHEIADEMFGGYCRGIGPTRLETAGTMGVPLVFAPGGLDNAVFSPYYPMPDELKGRRQHGHDIRFCVRMEAPEMERFARIVAEKLNKGRGPARVLIPKKGWSDADKEGMPLFDPAVDRVFSERLKALLDSRIIIEELDLHISEPAFAERAVDVLDGMITIGKS